jgi:hypothetical protein
MIILAAMSILPENANHLSLREKVELLLPAWRSWYPSLFHAAEDLGLIRARVCDPSTLMLSNRHASVQGEALQAFKQQWSVEDDPENPHASEEVPEHEMMLQRMKNAARHQSGPGKHHRHKRRS